MSSPNPKRVVVVAPRSANGKQQKSEPPKPKQGNIKKEGNSKFLGMYVRWWYGYTVCIYYVDNVQVCMYCTYLISYVYNKLTGDLNWKSRFFILTTSTTGQTLLSYVNGAVSNDTFKGLKCCLDASI